MAWMTVKEAQKLGLARRTIYDRVKREELASKKAEDGAILVWFGSDGRDLEASWKAEREVFFEEQQRLCRAFKEQQESHRLERESWAMILGNLTVQIENLGKEVSKLNSVGMVQRSAQSCPTVDSQRLPALSIFPVNKNSSRFKVKCLKEEECYELLEELLKVWEGSESSLERHLGLPRSWLWSAKCGKRFGPKSQKAWGIIRTFLGTRIFRKSDVA